MASHENGHIDMNDNMNTHFTCGIRQMKSPFTLLLLCMVLYSAFFALVSKAEMIWFDEAFSLMSCSHSCLDLWEYSRIDIHMPTYHYILKAWQFLFGSSICSAKLLSLLVTMLSTIVVYCLCKKIDSSKFGMQCALAYMLFPGVCSNATEIRMYALTGFCVIVATYFLMEIVNEPPRFKDYCFFSLSLLFSMALLNASVVFVATLSILLTVLLLLKKDAKKCMYGILSIVATGVLYSPILFSRLVAQCNNVKNDFWTSRLSIGDAFYVFVSQYLGRGHLRQLCFAYFFIIWSISLIGIFFILKNDDAKRKRMILICLACISMPMIFGAIASLILGRLVLIGRAMYPTIVFLVILHVYSIRALPWKTLRWIACCVLSIMFLNQVGSLLFSMRHTRHCEMQRLLSKTYKNVPVICFLQSFAMPISCYLPDRTIYIDKTFEDADSCLPLNANMRLKSLNVVNEKTLLCIASNRVSEEIESYFGKYNFKLRLVDSWEHEYSKMTYCLFEANRN